MDKTGSMIWVTAHLEKDTIWGFIDGIYKAKITCHTFPVDSPVYIAMTYDLRTSQFGSIEHAKDYLETYLQATQQPQMVTPWHIEKEPERNSSKF